MPLKLKIASGVGRLISFGVGWTDSQPTPKAFFYSCFIIYLQYLFSYSTMRTYKTRTKPADIPKDVKSIDKNSKQYSETKGEIGT